MRVRGGMELLGRNTNLEDVSEVLKTRASNTTEGKLKAIFCNSLYLALTDS